MLVETFGGTSNGNGKSGSGILGENREHGWKALPADAPEWVKAAVTEGRTAIIEGRSFRYVGQDGQLRSVNSAQDKIDEWNAEAQERLAASLRGAL